MARFNPFPKVDGSRGAPMGRACDSPGNFQDYPGKLYARYQRGGEGYDSGGAYWGLPSNVYAVWTRGGESVTYIRAKSEADAINRARTGADSL